jgi:hypothetical protein
MTVVAAADAGGGGGCCSAPHNAAPTKVPIEWQIACTTALLLLLPGYGHVLGTIHVTAACKTSCTHAAAPMLDEPAVPHSRHAPLLFLASCLLQHLSALPNQHLFKSSQHNLCPRKSAADDSAVYNLTSTANHVLVCVKHVSPSIGNVASAAASGAAAATWPEAKLHSNPGG